MSTSTLPTADRPPSSQDTGPDAEKFALPIGFGRSIRELQFTRQLVRGPEPPIQIGHFRFECANAIECPQVPQITRRPPLTPGHRLTRNERGPRGHRQLSSRCILKPLFEPPVFQRPCWATFRRQQLHLDSQTGLRPHHCTEALGHLADRRVPHQSPVAAHHRAWESADEITSDLRSGTDRNQVDVLTETTIDQMGSSQGCSADEYIPIREVRTQIAEQVRDQVIPFDLSARDTELRCHRLQLVGIHYFSPNRSCRRVSVVRIF